jgi:Raf kinase inhibitor-like YbhB/YbcL family protein
VRGAIAQQSEKAVKLTSTCFTDNAPIPSECAFCAPDPVSRATLSKNLNPDLSWSGLPRDTKSLVLICVDPDVPSRGDDVNKEGRSVPASLPRVDFYHWVLVDLPAHTSSIAKGEFASSITAKGKPGPVAARGARQGVNDFTGWFADDPEMAGNYFGYDGPCPPWNDELMHNYVFTLYALDIERCPLEGRFTGAEVLKAIRGHVLDEASLTGHYTLNPAVINGL